jgi:RND family efflux transporter MFP subunit
MSTSRPASGVLALIVGLAAVVGVTLWMLRDEPLPAPPGAPPPFRVPVTTTHIVTGDVSERIVLVGDVLAPDRAELAFVRDGRIRELPVRLGDVVKAGDLLARLDDSVVEEQVKASEASLAQAREMGALAQREAERMEKIEEVAATSAIDRAQAEARNAAAVLSQMEANLALERARLEQGVLSAPFDGVVTARPVALGSYVAAGDPCFELLSLEIREILLELPPRVVASVQPGAQVTLTSDELAGFELTAPLAAVLPSKEARARVFTGVVRLGAGDDPERRIMPGMFVRAQVELRTARGALTVPVDCVIEDANGARLAVIVPGDPPTADFVPITVLARDGERAAIQANGKRLAAGDEVIQVGKENVAPGMQLTVVPPLEAAAAPAAAPAESGEAAPHEQTQDTLPAGDR